MLAADDLAGGRLVRIGRSVPTRFAYYFVTRREPDERGRALAAWLRAELQRTRSVP